MFQPNCIEQLLLKEMMERQRLGKHYNCDETWVRHYRYKQQLYIVIYLALKRMKKTMRVILKNQRYPSQMMRLRAQIAGVTINTHDFINKDTMWHLEIPAFKHAELQVPIMNGERITSTGIGEGVTLQQEGISFATNMYILSLVGIKLFWH